MLVDTVTYIVCGSVGLDTSGSTVPYVAGWGEQGELEAIRDYPEQIDATARRTEDALDEESTTMVEPQASEAALADASVAVS